MANVKFKIDKCKGCGLCVEACPKKIISLSADIMNQKGFHPAAVTDPDKCLACAFCAIMCPDAVIEVFRDDKAFEKQSTQVNPGAKPDNERRV